MNTRIVLFCLCAQVALISSRGVPEINPLIILDDLMNLWRQSNEIHLTHEKIDSDFRRLEYNGIRINLNPIILSNYDALVKISDVERVVRMALGNTAQTECVDQLVVEADEKSKVIGDQYSSCLTGIITEIRSRIHESQDFVENIRSQSVLLNSVPITELNNINVFVERAKFNPMVTEVLNGMKVNDSDPVYEDLVTDVYESLYNGGTELIKCTTDIVTEFDVFAQYIREQIDNQCVSP